MFQMSCGLLQVFDKSGCGYITPSDLRAVLQCMGEELTEEESKWPHGSSVSVHIGSGLDGLICVDTGSVVGGLICVDTGSVSDGLICVDIGNVLDGLKCVSDQLFT